MKKYSKDSIGYKIPQGLIPDIKFTFIVLGYMVKWLSFFYAWRDYTVYPCYDVKSKVKTILWLYKGITAS